MYMSWPNYISYQKKVCSLRFHIDFSIQLASTFLYYMYIYMFVNKKTHPMLAGTCGCYTSTNSTIISAYTVRLHHKCDAIAVVMYINLQPILVNFPINIRIEVFSDHRFLACTAFSFSVGNVTY